ncbi:MAG: pyridoxamine 5'-phosphate oxidase family protein [Acidobacteriota bacterium]
MRPDEHWNTIRKVVSQSFQSSLHFGFATVNIDGTPHITPIGSLILNHNEPKGYYFELFTAKMPRNLERNKRVCIVAVNSGKWFWIKSLFFGRFATPPAVRLMGTIGELREATQLESEMFRRRIRNLRWFKGYYLLWEKLTMVREIEFDSFEPVYLGQMTRGHWSKREE